MKNLKIGILGAGNIGKTLTHKLAAAGYAVKVAHAESPETLSPETLSTGAKGVWAKDIGQDVDVLIISLPLNIIPTVASVISTASKETIIVDTSNYYPARDSKIQEIEDGQTESEWVQNLLGRPVVKTWNMILAHSLAEMGRPKGHPDRIAGTVSGDNEEARKIVMELVEATGFDAFDAGNISESWRQQPGAPVYCTELKISDLPKALASADRKHLPARRDLVMSVIMERMSNGRNDVTHDYVIRLNRAIYT